MGRLHATFPTVAKKCVWDLKYGLLGYSQFVAPEDIVHYLYTRRSNICSVLDLGCGRGSLLRALRDIGWTGSYCGVDISKWAINEARKIEDQRSSWVVRDLESFCSPFHWDVIAMVESIYYVRLSDLPRFLNRWLKMLNFDGTPVFRLHDSDKHQEYLETVLRMCPHTMKVDRNLFCIPDSTESLDRLIATSASATAP
ncbi:MAG: class I SAM-dependent methyltransferase [Terriglobales bacterium]